MKMFFRNIFIVVEFLEIKISHAIFFVPSTDALCRRMLIAKNPPA